MHVLAKRRGSALAYGLFLFSFTTAAEPAFAEVLISVNKSTQQMSVLVDGVPRYGFAVSNDRSCWIRHTKWYLPSAAFGCLMVLEALLQFANASFDLLPRRFCNSWQLRDQPAWQTGVARLHPLTPGERRYSLRVGEKRGYGGDDHCRLREQPRCREQSCAIATALWGMAEAQLRGSIQAR